MKNTTSIEAVLLDLKGYGADWQRQKAEKALEELAFIRAEAKRAVQRGEPDGGKYADVWSFLTSLTEDEA